MKVTFKDLSLPMKIAIIGGMISLFSFGLGLLDGLIKF